MCDKYNGWTNYQTWVFDLWLDDFFSDEADQFYHSNDSDFDAIRELEGYIKEWAEENNPIVDDASVWTDLVGHAIGMIDFFEIAEHYINDLISYNEFEPREKIWG